MTPIGKTVRAKLLISYRHDLLSTHVRQHLLARIRMGYRIIVHDPYPLEAISVRGLHTKVESTGPACVNRGEMVFNLGIAQKTCFF